MFPSRILGQGNTSFKNRNVRNAVKIFFCFSRGILGTCETTVKFLNKEFCKNKHNSSTVYLGNCNNYDIICIGIFFIFL